MVPSLFIGHGSPYLAVQRNEYSQFLQELGRRWRPKAIAIFSAHWESETIAMTYTDGTLETVYDYYGFPDEMYRIVYPAQGSAETAQLLERRLAAAGLAARREERRGLDHGSWVALKHMYPEADIPIVQLSVHPFLSPREQFKIGQALQGLGEDDVMVIGSGTTVHNLRWFFPEAKEPKPEALQFDDWIIDHVTKRDIDTLDRYLELAPHARLAVPRAEHIVPLFIAMGSGGAERTPTVLHRSYEFGTMSNLCFQF